MANIKVFEDKKIRTEWDSEKEDWWFSVHDVVQVLSDCKDVRDYIKKIQKVVEICHFFEIDML